MKYVNLFENFLFEIGDRSAKPYRYKVNGRIKNMSKFNERLYVYFTTDSGLEYTLTVTNIHMFLDVDFTVDGEYPETNRGEMFRIMATVSEVIENILKSNPEIRGLRYEPKAKSGQNDLGKSRDALYKMFIKKSIKKLNKSVEFVGGSPQQGGTVFAMIK
jgi:hypothetical protein